MTELHTNTETFFNSVAEEEFLFSFLNPDSVVLEYGCGKSTLAIAKRVKEIYSIEHDLKWANQMRPQLPPNATIIHVPRNSEEAPGDDGTYENYKNYVDYIKGIDKKFTICLVDGRARVHCAKAALDNMTPDGIIFVHDYKNPHTQYRRYEYEVVEEFLEEIGHEWALYAFKPKK